MKILVLLGVFIFLMAVILYPRRRDINRDWRLIFNGESPMKVRWVGSIVLLLVGVLLLLMIFVLAIAGMIVWLV